MCETTTILLAEDDEGHADLISRSIGRVSSSYHVDLVSDGIEAIDYLFGANAPPDAEGSEMPDLILLDLNMPRMDGREVLQVLSRVRHTRRFMLPPVVVLTVSQEETDLNEAYRLGAYDYLAKQVEFDRFSETIRGAIRYWHQLNEPQNCEELHAHQLHIPH